MTKVTKPRLGVKGKKTLDYESDDFSSSSDDSAPKATMGKHSVKELFEEDLQNEQGDGARGV